MTLPNNFQSTEHFQDVAKKIYNRDVREWFSDITADEIETSRGSLRQACTHMEDDSLLLTVGRMMLFENTIRARFAHRGTGETSFSPKVIRKNRPKVLLYFLEDHQDIENGYAPVAGEIGFRLMSETEDSLTESKLISVAQKIKSEFGSNSGYIWKKGKVMASYTDWENGYQFQLLCRSESEAKALIGKVLDIQNHNPEWERLNISENSRASAAYPTVPQTERILGESRRLPRRRPIASVRFQYAAINLKSLANPIALYDRSRTWSNPILK